MTKGIDLAVAADTRSAMSAITRGLIDPLEDVSELLEKIGDQRDTEQLERDMRDAGRRTEDAKDEIRDLRDELNRAGRAGKTAGDDIQDGMRRAERGAEDFKSEANSTAREAAASFDGSAESIGDAFQEVAANAFGGFGPAGAVAGLAAAAGIGLAMSGFTDVEEANKRAQESAAEWAQKYIESGQRVATAAQQVAGTIDIYGDPELYAQAKENAEAWGVSVGTAVLAMAGNEPALRVVADAVDRLGEASAREAQEAQKAAEAAGGQLTTLTLLEQQYATATQKLDELRTAQEQGRIQADQASESLKQIIDDYDQVGVEVDELGNKLVTLPDGEQIFIDVETGQASQNVDQFKGDYDQKIDQMNGREVVAKVAVDDSAVRNYRPPIIRLRGQLDIYRTATGQLLQ